MGRRIHFTSNRRMASCLFLILTTPVSSFHCRPCIRHNFGANGASLAGKQQPQQQQHRLLTSRHAAAKRGEGASSRADGVYSRPSAAIERGSGFFFPGLEGPKVRLLGGSVLLVATAANHFLSPGSTTAGNTFSEGLAAVFSTIVLFQAAIESVKESRGNVIVGSSAAAAEQGAATTTTTLQQQWSMAGEVDAAWRQQVEWAATTYLSLTPATHMLLVGPGSLLYWLGVSEPPGDLTQVATACQAACETARLSSSGRVSIPLTHPACAGLLLDTSGSNDDANKALHRSVVLQRVSPESQLCWMMTSDQLLASFTKQDLQWLGQLALYIDP